MRKVWISSVGVVFWCTLLTVLLYALFLWCTLLTVLYVLLVNNALSRCRLS